MTTNYYYDDNVAHVIRRVLQGFRPIIGREQFLTCAKEERQGNIGEYDFVPSAEEDLKVFLSILKKEKIKCNDIIVDLGCGVSPILIYLKFIGYYNLYGVDNEENYVKSLRVILGEYTNIVTGDLLDKDFLKDWIIPEAKVLYTYKPFIGSRKYHQFISNVWELMSPGSIIVDFHGPIYNTLSEEDSLLPGHSKYYKKS